jgi:hypothetical protein
MNTIKVKDYTKINEEFTAAAAITPGMLVEETSAGKVQAHSTAAGAAQLMIALEDELQGDEISDAYSSGDPVQVWVPRRGDMANMILASGEDVSIGDALESDGNGRLRAETSGNVQIVAYATEAVDLSDSGDTASRIIVRIA